VLTCLGFIPRHFWAGCQESQGLVMYAGANFLAVICLCLLIPRQEKARFEPAAFALIALIAHLFVVH
jgi:hypothetical protein